MICTPGGFGVIDMYMYNVSFNEPDDNGIYAYLGT
jgi:hypothetical protein